jgi:hypothetical protein
VDLFDIRRKIKGREPIEFGKRKGVYHRDTAARKCKQKRIRITRDRGYHRRNQDGVDEEI